MDTVCALVAAGAGLAAEPNADRRDPVRRAGVVSIPLTEPDLTHRIEIWWHRNAHPPVTEFAAAVLAASGLCGRVSTR